MSDSYIIQGGYKLQGEVNISGAKNASVKLMIASVLFDTPVTLHNIPNNQDNHELTHLLRELGVFVSHESHIATIDPKGIQNSKISLLYGSKIRSSFLLFGPLLKKFGVAWIPNPGGCRIGARSISRVINGFEALGVTMKYHSESGYYEARSNGKIQGEYTFEKPTHTGTEALILASVCGGGRVILNNSALEPEIDDLISFLNLSGANIVRSDRTIIIDSVPTLGRSEPYKVISDRNEAVTYAALAYATKGDITLSGIKREHIEAFLSKVTEAGGGIEYLGDDAIRFYYKGKFKAVNIETAPHPGYMTDWQPQWGLLMATAEGESIIHETILESRLNYVQELQKVGAKIEFFDPKVENPQEVYQFAYDPKKEYMQAVRITGVDHLHNGALTVHDIRAGAVVVLAALSAHGESVVNGISQIERGYENLVEKLTSIGAKIVRT